MTMKKINEQEIQDLYKFTRAHFVEHFDVQTELVDHLANDIEAIWQEDPNLTFVEARDRSFKKFGVFGFMDMYETRKNTLIKKYFKILWRFMKEWFKLPKIVLTSLIFIIYYTGLESIFSDYIYKISLITIVIFAVAKGIYLIHKIKKKQSKQGKKWLLEDIIYKGTFFNGIMLYVHLHNLITLGGYDNSDLYFSLTFSSIFTLLIIWIHLSLNVLPKNSEELLEEQYPEYKLV